MIQINYKPPPSLAPLIDRYWSFETNTEKGIGLFPLIVGTGLDFIIHFASPFQTEKEILPPSHTFCPRQTIAIQSKGKLNFLAIRFKCGAFRHFCPIHFKELNNQFLSVQDIWGKAGTELTDKLYSEQSPSIRIEILNTFLLKQLKIHGRKVQGLDASIAYIYKNFEDIAIYSLAANMNISLRHFERLFKNEFGISPKKFQVISRFQATLKEILLSSGKDYMDIAFRNGYYDQSHFIKECRYLSGASPIELINMKEEKCHFYFKRINP